MRNISTEALLNRTTERVIAARLTIRDTRLVFTERVNYDSLGLSDPSTLDACEHDTGILRVVNYLNELCYQIVPDVSETDAWDIWVHSTITLKDDSRPGVEDSRIWYQKANGDICYRDMETDLGSEVLVTSAYAAFAVTVAPISIDLAYVHFFGNDWARIVALESDGGATEWSGRVFGTVTTARFFDAVRLDGVDHVFFADADNGRLMTTIVQEGVWSDPRYVVPLDVVDETSFFKLAYAHVIDGRVWLTGRLSRATEHTVPVAFDVYMIGPNYTMGRDLFIQQDEAGGKLFIFGDLVYYIAANSVATAGATLLVGNDLASKKVQITKFRDFMTTCSTSQADKLMVGLDPSVEPTQLRLGSQMALEAAYGGEYFDIGVYGVDTISPQRGPSGEDKLIAGRGWAMKRLADWKADQSYDYWSQAKQSANPADQTELVRVTGRWDGDPIELEELNLDGIMYAVAKPSRGGLARVRCKYPTGDFNPLFGPAICYYRESRAEAAERLGIESKDVTENDYGNNGFYALWGETEHSSAAGVGLYVMHNNVMTKLTSAALSISPDTWYWLQIEFHEGELRGMARADGDPDWTQLFVYTYDDIDHLPWARETFGRGAIFANNGTIASDTPGFGHTSTVVPVESNAAFPITEIVLVDGEQISYDGKSGNYDLPEMTYTEGYTHYWAQHQNTDWTSYSQVLRAQLKIDATPIAPMYGVVNLATQPANNGAYTYIGKGIGGPWGRERFDKVRLYLKKTGNPTNPAYVHIVNDAWDWSPRGEGGIIGNWNYAHRMMGHVHASSIGTSFGWIEFDLTVETPEPQRWVDPNYKSGYWIVLTLQSNNPVTALQTPYDASNYYTLRLDETLNDPKGCTSFLHLGHGGGPDWHFNFFRGDRSQFPDAEIPYQILGVSNAGPGYEIYIDGVQDQCGPEDYKDMALVVVDGPGKGSVFRVLAFDYQAPDQWKTSRVYASPDSWDKHVNEVGHGSWVTPDMARVFVQENPSSIIGEGSIFKLYPTLIVDERGYDSTVAASHGPVTVSLYRDLHVQVGNAEFYSLERDMTIEDLAVELAAKCGVLEVSGKRALEGDVALIAGEPEWLTDRLNFVADFDVPVMSTGDAVGVAFRSLTAAADVDTMTQGYQLVLTSDSYLELRRLDTSWETVERYPVPFTPVGNIRISVQGPDFSVWIAGRFVHSFHDATHTTGLYAGMVSDDNLTVDCDWQDVDVFKDNYIFDIGTSGLSLMGGIINTRRIYYGDGQNGELRLFRTRDVVPGSIDLLVDLSLSQEDPGSVTRIRSEGAAFAEAVDYVRLRTEGNKFALVNASEANDAWDAYNEAVLQMAESASASSRTMPASAADPRVQCGDIVTIETPDGNVSLIVEGISFSMKLSEDEISFDMEIDGRAA
jgi:hypothetical protein